MERFQLELINIINRSCLTCYNNERHTGQKQQLFDGKTVKNKGKLILIELPSSFPIEKSSRRGDPLSIVFNFTLEYISPCECGIEPPGSISHGFS